MLVFIGFLSSGFIRVSPEALDISSMARSSFRAYLAKISVPSGFFTMVSINFASSASAIASTLPSPPSATGFTTTSQKSSSTSFIARPASSELSEPFNESIATKILIKAPKIVYKR